jgi:cell division protein FtsB
MAAAQARRRVRGRGRGRIVARRWLAAAALVLVGLLYYRPLHDYLAARGQLGVRVSAVRKLQREHQALEHRLQLASSPDVLAREARALGYVHPGEHLFIVKDLPQWRRRQNASRRGHRH